MENSHSTENLLEQYKNAVDLSMIVSKTNPKGIITYVNDQFCDISGYTQSELIGQNHNIIRHPDMDKEAFKQLWGTIKSKKVWKGLVKNKTKDGKEYFVDTVIIPILDDNDNIIEYIGLRNDITKLFESEKLLEKTKIDDLTKLKSRVALIEDKDAIDDQKLALIDIRSFRHINDFYGHNIGDTLLKVVAKELKEFFKGYECKLYRVPIDIFAILTSQRIESLEDKVKKFSEYIATKPINITDSHIYINIVSGLATYKDGKTIYQNADIALQYAKSHKKQLQIYNNELNLQKEIEQNLLWTQRLNEAIYDDKVQAFYQPIINNKTMKCDKFESLVRIIDENENVISPFYFLDISKQTKLYSYLTKIVLEQSLERFKDTPYSFSINLAVDDFENEKTLNMLFDVLKSQEIANKVVLEITESEEIQNFELITDVISQFKEYGCKIAIDDFGSGYSNFTYLMKLQADFIKIDGSLIKNIDTDLSSQSIVKAIVSFANEMNILTIAEYVHNEIILEKVKELGIDYSQGFHLGMPKKGLDIDASLLD